MNNHLPPTLQASLKKIALLVMVSAAAAIVFGPAAAQAQVPAPNSPVASLIGITAIPPRLGEDFNFKAKPGEKVQAVLQVRNSSDTTMPLDVSVEDFILSEDGSTPIPVTDEVSNRWSLANWVTVSPQKMVLEPREIATVNVIVDVPADALPGGHYGMVIYQPDLELLGDPNSPFASLDSSSGIGQRVGTLMYFVVEGPINEEAFIRDFEFPKFTEFGPVPYSFTVENVSDIHIRPQIKIDVYNLFGQKVDTIETQPKNVFPFVARDFDGQWDRTWGIGLYRAVATMSYGSGGQVAMAQTSFWLLPYKLLLAIIFIILSIVGIIISVRRHLIHRQDLTRRQVTALQQRVAELEEEQRQAPITPVEPTQNQDQTPWNDPNQPNQ